MEWEKWGEGHRGKARFLQHQGGLALLATGNQASRLSTSGVFRGL